MNIAYNRYSEANIPIDYWNLNMNDFSGSKSLKNAYDYLTTDIAKVYNDGVSICFSGTNGVGKTMTVTCILKKVCQKNYSALYTTLNDMITTLVDAPYEEKFYAKKELMLVDFLVLDEFDSKYVSDASADLFGRTVEAVVRTRLQNKLPTFFCSNSPNPVEMFQGAIKISIESLFNKVKIIPIMDKDFRKENK
jgi:DNA replication protein DnaC